METDDGVRGGKMAATGGGGQRKQMVVFVEEERHDGNVAVADACCLYFLGFQNECV